MDSFKKIFDEIVDDPENKEFTDQGILPLYGASKEARIIIIGQAPGRIAQEKRMFWDDPSGDRLRDWMGISRDVFYNSGKICVLPMDFYFPGKGKSGDKPPRKGFAEKWHPRILALMPNVKLTILIGAYANRKYLHLKTKDSLTEIVKNYKNYLPEYFPIVHPSPRNRIWEAKNPWFEETVVPELRKRVQKALQ